MHEIFKNIDITYKKTVKRRGTTLNEWELRTNSNVINANKEMNRAKRLRCYIDMIIKRTIDDLKKQESVTNEAFRQRIEQTREAKTKLELQHSEVCKKKDSVSYKSRKY